MKKSILVPVVTLVLAALLLFGASWGLKGVAAANAQKEHLRILRTVLPGSSEFTVEPYGGEDSNIVSVHKGENGFVVETCTYGYAGEITMMIGVSNAGTVTGLVVMDLSETFGLGANALNDHVFLAQFLNTAGDVAIATGEVSSDITVEEDASSSATSSATSVSPSDASVTVDAITGATVTSKAVARCVNSAVAYVTGADIDSAATSWGG